MKRFFFSHFVFAALLTCVGMSVVSCSEEDMPVVSAEIPDSDAYGAGGTRAIAYTPYSKFTFVLHANKIENGAYQTHTIADLYDIRVAVSPVRIGVEPADGAYRIDFLTDPAGLIPDNFIEFRINTCLYDGENLRPSPMESMKIVMMNAKRLDGTLSLSQFEKSIVVVQLQPKAYIKDMDLKPRLLVSYKPLSELVTPGATPDEICIHIYYDCGNMDYCDPIEFDPENPPVWAADPGKNVEGGSEVQFKDGTEKLFYELRTTPLPKYDLQKYSLQEWVDKLEAYRMMKEEEQKKYPELKPYKNYYASPCLVPNWL